VVSPRSGTCGRECAARPCTLRELRRGQQALDDLPWVRQWADLAVLAHLTGWPMPVPTPPALHALRAQPRRLMECALSHAADAAVTGQAVTALPPSATGRPGIARPAALAAHVAAAISARVTDGVWECYSDEPQWLLTPEAVQALDASGALDGLAERFIDCEWPHLYVSGSPATGSPATG
jgi:hypothetical protein